MKNIDGNFEVTLETVLVTGDEMVVVLLTIVGIPSLTTLIVSPTVFDVVDTNYLVVVVVVVV